MPVSIKAKPSFPWEITIATPEGPLQVTLEYKHMTTDAYKAFWDDARAQAAAFKKRVDDATAAGETPPEMEDTSVNDVMDIVVGWQDFDTPFSREAMAEFMQNYHLAALPIFEGWREGLRKGKLKNS